MESDESEWAIRVGDYGVRDATDEEADPDDWSWTLCRVSTGEVIAVDGGEPEDQTLVRAWRWIPQALADAERRGAEDMRRRAVEVCERRARRAVLHSASRIAEEIAALPVDGEPVTYRKDGGA